MSGSHHGEMATIQRRKLRDFEPLAHGHDRRIDGSKRKISIPRRELGNAQPIRGDNRFGDEVAAGQVTEKPHLRIGSQASFDQVGHLGHDEDRDDDRPRMVLQELEARVVVPVVGVDVGVQGSRVDEQRYRFTSARRISSIRSEMSEWPLCPAPAARSLRFPLRSPRCASIASRVSSETVVSRRSASCRNRASRSSGSFTVVRFMVCQHTARAQGSRPRLTCRSS